MIMMSYDDDNGENDSDDDGDDNGEDDSDDDDDNDDDNDDDGDDDEDEDDDDDDNDDDGIDPKTSCWLGNIGVRMGWCHEATSLYPNNCSPNSVMSYDNIVLQC